MSIQGLVKTTRLHRTTVYWPLGRLQERGLAAFDLVGKRKRWYAVADPFSLLGKVESTDTQAIKGVEAIRRLYNKALESKRTDRVLILEGTKAIHSVARKGGVEFLERWHIRAHEKGIIVESILGEKTLRDLANQLVHAKVVKSLARWRLWVGYTVPDEFIDFDATLVVFGNRAILADWERGYAVSIENTEIVALIKSFCRAYKMLGKKIDIVKYIKTIAPQ
ncbi:MAG TPA: hypothetical protein VGP13_02485 [Candidatus Paceibacterota bacterium]|nr:hypothetical protein [Candidatus Paceibacterota bacterium]